jgi:hypothetical protein
MENTSNVFAAAERSFRAMDGVPQSRAYWPMARAAHMDLYLTNMRRVNLLVTGPDADVEDALARLMPTLRRPIQTWTPADPLELPSPTESGTLIVRNVAGLPPADQYRMLVWLEMSGGRTQVVSTTASPLLPLVEAGVFHDTLYYRLNVVCVDLTT